jgi:hypothetical protein
MRWSTFILVAGAVAMTGCAPPPDWERMENPDIKGKTGMAAVDNFVDANGWNMNKSPFALFSPGGGRQGRLRGLPWSRLTNSTCPALTSKGILYVALRSSGNGVTGDVTGVAYNPNTNRFPKEVAGFKPLADHWYVWTLLAEDPATRAKLTRRYEGQN